MPKVLVVDDEPKILKIVEHCLIREGYEVITALDGCQAIELFLRQEPDLVILDLMLPHVDGF
ncbi:MAG: response regulator [Desulfosporosinus sp.]|nr:response regulator [Desulfosporosinus sp.]